MAKIAYVKILKETTCARESRFRRRGEGRRGKE